MKTTTPTTPTIDRLGHALKWCKTNSRRRCNRIGLIYVIQCGEFTKVGITQSVKNRLKMLQTGNPGDLQLLASWKSEQCLVDEQAIHKHLAPFSVRGEWFKLPCEVLEGLIGI